MPKGSPINTGEEPMDDANVTKEDLQNFRTVKAETFDLKIPRWKRE